MNSKAVKIMGEVLLAIVIAVLLSYIPEAGWSVRVDFSVIPLIFVALRQGTIWGFIASILFGVVNVFLHGIGNGSALVPVVDSVLAYGFVGLAGLFARNTVRTAFNARTSSTVLNIVTASLIASIVSGGLHIVAASLGGASYLEEQQIALVTSVSSHWIGMLTTFAVTMIVLVGLVYVRRSVYVPKGTRYLSRKEQSHLLND